MRDGELFKIGDVAKMFHMSVGSLRHYEQEGLVTPEYVDPHTGYRYYSVRQFEMLTNICYLRALDMPLSQIAEFLQNRDVDIIEDKLQRQKDLIVEKKRQLEVIERKLEHRLEQLRDASNSKLDEIKLIHIPASRLVWIRDSLKWKSYLDLEHSIRQLEKNQKVPITFQGKVGVGIHKENLMAQQFDQYDLVFIILDEEDTYEGEVEKQSAGEYVSIRFCGCHRDAPAYYQKLLDYIKEHHMTITGFSREITLIDDVMTKDTDKFVTEISIPIAERS